MFVLFTLFKLTLDERKTLTKISMRTTSHNHSPNQRAPRNKRTSKSILHNSKRRRRCLHNWWRIRSIRISSRNNGRIKKTTRLVLYQTLHYFVPDYLHFGCIVLANVISTKNLILISRQITTKFSTKFKSKTLFSTRVRDSKSKHYFVTPGNCCKFQLQNSKP